MTFATVWACFLPSVKHGNYIYVEDTGITNNTNIFSKSVIHDPIVPKYSAENLHLKNVSIRLILFCHFSCHIQTIIRRDILETNI